MRPSNAFQKNGRMWHSMRKLPQLIWMYYEKPHVLQRIDITSNYNEHAPRSFEVIGSMDCATWTTMLNVPEAGFGGGGPSLRKSFIIPLANRRAFPCIGLRVNTIWMMRRGYVRIPQIDLWEQVTPNLSCIMPEGKSHIFPQILAQRS